MMRVAPSLTFTVSLPPPKPKSTAPVAVPPLIFTVKPFEVVSVLTKFLALVTVPLLKLMVGLPLAFLT